MRKRRGLLLLGLGVVGVIALANAARYALVRQPLLQSDHVVFEQSYSLFGAVDDNLVVVAETVDLNADSRVNGHVALIGSQMQVNGQITGDLTVLGDRIEFGPDAKVTGNVTLLVDEVKLDGTLGGALNIHGDTLTIAPGAHVAGDIFACVDTLSGNGGESNPIRPCDEGDLLSSTETLQALRDPNVVIPLLNITVGGAAILVLFSALGSLALSGLSILAVVMFPRQISHIEEAIRLNPRHLGVTGVLLVVFATGVTFAAGALMAAVPALGLVLIPAYLVIAVLFFGMALTGWITLTLIVGDVIVRRLGQVALPPLVIAAAGNISLLLIWNLLALNSVSRLIGLVALGLLGAVGLGAAFTTRMGTKPAHKSYLVQG
jgi:cytoskeletal protein CcmA (bactofilin family)